ncbi:phosphotransferase family protein [Falsibacillus pallidus]|uniref:phosphotransferase family protein n=1 Tax=Falsibacillus pallidus TaxID=493781 RepID=UPI003D9946FA
MTKRLNEIVLGTPIAHGNTADIFLWENKIVKLYKEHLPESEAGNEAKKQLAAYSSGLPVPKVLEVSKVNGRQVLIMEYVKGETLGDLLQKNIEKTEYYLSVSVDLQMNMHKKETNELVDMPEKLRRQLKNASILTETQKEGLIQKLSTMVYEPRICHGDFHLYNLVQSDENFTILDWVDASSGDIRADVYRSYLLYSEVSSELAENYLRIYCEKSGLNKTEIMEWAPIIAGARLSENVSSENEKYLMKIVAGDRQE